MSDGNPLVAGPVDTATPFSGAGLLDDGTQLAQAIESGNWVEGGLAAFSTAVDTVATVSDPLGSLIAAGLGWLMDHFEPLKSWLNDLTGDAGEVQAFAQTWNNVSVALHSSGDELTRILGDVDTLQGEAMDAYRRFQTDSAAHIHGAGDWASAMSTGLTIGGTIVQLVHDLVRDVIAQLVGSAISWVAEIVFSFGLATPWVIEQVATRVASVSAKIGTKLTALLNSVRKLASLLDELRALLSRAGDLMNRLLKGKTPDMPTIAMRPLTAAEKYRYRRPSGYRKGIRDEVYDDARDPGGVVIDPTDGRVLPSDQPWDMGHRPGYEFRKHQVSAADRNITREIFLDEHNTPGHYRPEYPPHNQGHLGEDPTDIYLGP